MFTFGSIQKMVADSAASRENVDMEEALRRDAVIAAQRPATAKDPDAAALCSQLVVS